MIFIFKIVFLEIEWIDFIDISLVAILLYQIYKLIKGSIAVNIFIGILALYLIYLIVRAAKMELLTSILGQFMSIGMLAALILFQQEIRKFLLVIGKRTEVNKEIFTKPFAGWIHQNHYNLNLQEIINAIKTLQTTQTGALIVLSKNSEMKFYIETGDILNAVVSHGLLLSIFNKNSPLHDGAVIIHDGKIKAARCVLPVSDNQTLPAHYGLRHRSAIGISEITNALVVAVSEETGTILMAYSGIYTEKVTLTQVKRRITAYLEDKESKDWERLG